MAMLSNTTVSNESLDSAQWEPVGFGGFGHVFKARHKDWGFDVAIKIPHSPINPMDKALCEEVNHMQKASCQFVLRVYGNYLGSLPFGPTTTMRQGIVMEYMRRGSVQSLMSKLSGPQPWPLVFRLAHQVAQGMNFLHTMNLMHHDLKPSNVLLNDDLNAKIADFGLSRVSTSVSNSNGGTKAEIGGSYKYMPPEAFETSYKPVRAFDRYSYGILLWSIVTGKEPYPTADYNLVALKIPLGDRPHCGEIDLMKAEGFKEMVHLMERCWEKNPLNRPTFKECLKITEGVLSKHKKGMYAAVHHVLTILDSQTRDPHLQTSVSFSCPLQAPATQSKSKDDVMDHVRFIKTEQPSKQQDSVTVSGEEMSDADKSKFVDGNMAELIQSVSEVLALVEELGDMVHGETYSAIKAKTTSQDKMRMLYERTFRAGGMKVKAAFYDILKTHYRELVERLGRKF